MGPSKVFSFVVVVVVVEVTEYQSSASWRICSAVLALSIVCCFASELSLLFNESVSLNLSIKLDFEIVVSSSTDATEKIRTDVRPILGRVEVEQEVSAEDGDDGTRIKLDVCLFGRVTNSRVIVRICNCLMAI
jgi:hypothetical protein